MLGKALNFVLWLHFEIHGPREAHFHGAHDAAAYVGSCLSLKVKEILDGSGLNSSCGGHSLIPYTCILWLFSGICL